MSEKGQRTAETKTCQQCGGVFAKRSKFSRAQWERATFCSTSCRSDHDRGDGWADRNGRYWISVRGKLQARSRVVYETSYGPLPEGAVIDHINRDPSDDRIENLRVFASHSEHMRYHAKAGHSGFQTGHAPNKQMAATASGRMTTPSTSTTVEASTEPSTKTTY